MSRPEEHKPAAKASAETTAERRAREMDQATGLPNRTIVVECLEEMLADPARSEEDVIFALLDIDLFHQANETHGEAWGDTQIQTIARLLLEEVADLGVLYRYGGDAFALVSRSTEKEQVFLALERCRHRITQECPGLTLSAGIAAFPDNATRANDLINKASEALYRAKVTGRNKVCLSREEKMTTKTSHYSQGQLMGLRRLAERTNIGEAFLLREALHDLLRKHNA